MLLDNERKILAPFLICSYSISPYQSFLSSNCLSTTNYNSATSLVDFPRLLNDRNLSFLIPFRFGFFETRKVSDGVITNRCEISTECSGHVFLECFCWFLRRIILYSEFYLPLSLFSQIDNYVMRVSFHLRPPRNRSSDACRATKCRPFRRSMYVESEDVLGEGVGSLKFQRRVSSECHTF